MYRVIAFNNFFSKMYYTNIKTNLKMESFFIMITFSNISSLLTFDPFSKSKILNENKFEEECVMYKKIM